MTHKIQITLEGKTLKTFFQVINIANKFLKNRRDNHPMFAEDVEMAKAVAMGYMLLMTEIHNQNGDAARKAYEDFIESMKEERDEMPNLRG
jgi:hypothetical protein